MAKCANGWGEAGGLEGRVRGGQGKDKGLCVVAWCVDMFVVEFGVWGCGKVVNAPPCCSLFWVVCGRVRVAFACVEFAFCLYGRKEKKGEHGVLFQVVVVQSWFIDLRAYFVPSGTPAGKSALAMCGA